MSGPFTIFDAGMRGSDPSGAHGEFSPFGQGHYSQWYGDGYRVSWDSDYGAGLNYDRLHWTNQNMPKSDPGRHFPAGDAR